MLRRRGSGSWDLGLRLIAGEQSISSRVNKLLPKHFYAHDALEVAPKVLGAMVCGGEVVLRITEVEAYRWPDDTANHGRHGRTRRNDALWGPPGCAYVYLCYGIHHLLNLVTGEDGQPSAVLIRACEPVEGLDTIRARRGGLTGTAILTGPGKVAQALGLDLGWNRHPLYLNDGLELRRGSTATEILSGPRVGVDYALPEHRDAPWRFALAGTPWISRRQGLTSDNQG